MTVDNLRRHYRIADKVNGRCFIMVDGTVARGTDVEKYLAHGAQCTLAGRHFVRAAHGGLVDGVALFANKLKSELAVAMVLTGAQRVSDINRKNRDWTPSGETSGAFFV